MSLLLAYITNPSQEEAKRVAKHLLDKRIIACANIFKIKSMYWWEGKIEEGDEWVVIAKTTQQRIEQLEAEVKAIHPYKIPCIIRIKADANQDYLGWLEGEIKQR
ncbi:divalent-cation tolerance protein CutA [Candidatus Woesearchaeota archaeon]|nr:divalent-cation tolerance protein CutA [Candidatus Woesearchaeota archaeon]RLE42584.1 MAG: divalent-cation tolerance protein CutA [Candidatus Woesearchaeota archaeon]